MSDSDGQMSDVCQTSDGQMSAQYSIGKYSIESSLEQLSTEKSVVDDKNLNRNLFQISKKATSNSTTDKLKSLPDYVGLDNMTIEMIQYAVER